MGSIPTDTDNELSVNQLNQFYQLYFSHPYFAGHTDVRLRVIFLPSNYLVEKSEASRIEVYPHEMQLDFKRNVETGALETDTKFYNKRILAAAARGYDCYYFLNAVRSETPGEKYPRFTNADIEQVIYLPLDIDDVGCAAIVDDYLGSACAWIVQSSFGKKHFVLAINQTSNGTEKRWKAEEWADFGRDWCQIFRSDAVFDAKRILRLPGTINWKGAVSDEDGKDEKRFSRIIGSDENFMSFDLETLRITLENAPDMPEKIRKPKSNKRQEQRDERGEGGDYGHWLQALEKARLGEWTFSKDCGFRHNALRTWAAQMAWSAGSGEDGVELTPELLEANIRLLASGAFEDGYEEKRDISALVRTTLKYFETVSEKQRTFDATVEEWDEEAKKWELSDKFYEAEARLRQTAVEPFVRDIDPETVISDFAARQIAREDARQNPPKAEEPKHTDKVEKAVRIEAPADAPIVEVDKRQKIMDLDTGLVGFIHSLCDQAEDETEAQHLKWLLQVGILVNRALLKDRGVFEPACGSLTKRLERYGMLREGKLIVPEWQLRFDGREVLRPRWLNEDEQRAFLVEYVSAVAMKIYFLKKKIRELPEADGMMGKKAKVFFACKAGTMSALVNGIAGKILLGGQKALKDENVIVFQNGVFNIRKGSFDTDYGVTVSGGRSRWWHQARWRYLNPIACWFGLKDSVSVGVGTNGTALAAMPMFAKYLNDTFDGEINRVTREDLVPRILGYSMTRGNPAQVFFAFIGLAGSGKGLMCELAAHLAGRWNTARVSYAHLDAPWGFFPMEEKIVCIADEAESATRKTHEDVMSGIKKYTGASEVALRGMHENERTVDSTAKIFITCNKDLTVNDAGGALSRRIVCLYFANVRGKDEQRDNLSVKIFEAEGDLIATWAAIRLSEYLVGKDSISGLFELGESGALNVGKEKLSEMIDPVLMFVRECVKRTDGRDENGRLVGLKSSTIIELIRILVDMDRMSRVSGRVSDVVKRTMSKAGFEYSRERSGSVYAKVAIDVQSLIEKYDIERDALLQAVRSGPLGYEGSKALGLEEIGGQLSWGAEEE